MTSQNSQTAQTDDATASLERTIDKAKEVAAEIRQAADHLAVVNTVLETQLPDHVQVGEVAQALDHSDAVEKQLNESAERLEEVNAELEQGAKVAAGQAGAPAGGQAPSHKR